MFALFFEKNYLLNLFILSIYTERSPHCARISKQKLRTIHRGKKCNGTGLVSEITEALHMQT